MSSIILRLRPFGSCTIYSRQRTVLKRQCEAFFHILRFDGTTSDFPYFQCVARETAAREAILIRTTSTWGEPIKGIGVLVPLVCGVLSGRTKVRATSDTFDIFKRRSCQTVIETAPTMHQYLHRNVNEWDGETVLTMMYQCIAAPAEGAGVLIPPACLYLRQAQRTPNSTSTRYW